jgi:hypothetical protein
MKKERGYVSQIKKPENSGETIDISKLRANSIPPPDISEKPIENPIGKLIGITEKEDQPEELQLESPEPEKPRLDLAQVYLSAEDRMATIGQSYHLVYDDEAASALAVIETVITKLSGKMHDRKVILLYSIKFFKEHLINVYLDQYASGFEPYKLKRRIASWDIEKELDNILTSLLKTK